MTGYWDNVAEKMSKDGILRDNWIKRRGLVRNLLGYDMTNANILEIGCGFALTATMLNVIYGGHFKYVGTDISAKFCDLATKNTRLKTVHAWPNDLPFEDMKFNCLFAFDILEHIPKHERPAIWQELNRVLKHDAFIFINDPHPDNPCGHSEEVEHGFNEVDLLDMVVALNAEIIEHTTYKGSEGYKYRFIVLRRK